MTLEQNTRRLPSSYTDQPYASPQGRRRWFSQVALLGVVLTGLFLLLVIFAYLDVSRRHRDRIFTEDEVEARRVALVFGAGVYPSGRLSAVLSDRMQTAIALYEAGKVQKLLLSGDNSVSHYNEPARMGEYAMRMGVPASDLVYDYGGRRTYDSCHRAANIFTQDRLILVTQAFHLPRALYLCEQMGIDAVGVAADRRSYRLSGWFTLRETLASIQAWVDVHLLHPTVIAGDPIEISFDGTP